MTLESQWNSAKRSLEAFARTRGGHVVLLYLATLLWTVLWAVFDYIVVVRAFPHPLAGSQDIGFFWIAAWYIIFPLTTLFVFRRHWWLPLAAVLFAGWEDVLFYWIQGVPVPQHLPWLAPYMTDALLYLRALAFLVLSVVAEIGSHRLAPRRRTLVAGAGVTVLGILLSLPFTILFLALVVPFYLIVERLVASIGRTDDVWTGGSRRTR